MSINRKGLVENPVYPCYKGEGLCQLRTMETDKFKCVKTAATCRYRKVIVKEKVADEVGELWEKLESEGSREKG